VRGGRRSPLALLLAAETVCFVQRKTRCLRRVRRDAFGRVHTPESVARWAGGGLQTGRPVKRGVRGTASGRAFSTMFSVVTCGERPRHWARMFVVVVVVVYCRRIHSRENAIRLKRWPRRMGRLDGTNTEPKRAARWVSSRVRGTKPWSGRAFRFLFFFAHVNRNSRFCSLQSEPTGNCPVCK